MWPRGIQTDRPFLRFLQFITHSSDTFCLPSRFFTTFHSSNLVQICSGLIISFESSFQNEGSHVMENLCQINLLFFWSFSSPARDLRVKGKVFPPLQKQQIKLYLQTLSFLSCHYFSITFNPLLQQWLSTGWHTDLFLPLHASSYKTVRP